MLELDSTNLKEQVYFQELTKFQNSLLRKTSLSLILIVLMTF